MVYLRSTWQRRVTMWSLLNTCCSTRRLLMMSHWTIWPLCMLPPTAVTTESLNFCWTREPIPTLEPWYINSSHSDLLVLCVMFIISHISSRLCCWFLSERFHAVTHRLQEEPSESDGAVGEIWRVHSSHHWGTSKHRQILRNKPAVDL